MMGSTRVLDHKADPCIFGKFPSALRTETSPPLSTHPFSDAQYASTVMSEQHVEVHTMAKGAEQ